MVRTDRKTRAMELKGVYSQHTSLNLQTINSSHSLSHVKRALKALKEGDLDGIICVDMLGEGFDFPNLKLAAVHSPHRSLEVTLQFIGRFARTGDAQLGQARFFAVPSEIKSETDRLYKEGAIWGEMVHNLSQTRIEREQRIRQTFGRFLPPQVSEEMLDISLAALRPYFHVKIYQVSTDVNIATEVELPNPLETIFHTYSEEDQTAIFITREIEQPRWISWEEFSRIQYDLFVVVYDPTSRLLFINSSIRSTTVYEAVSQLYTSGQHQILSLARVNRVLTKISDTEFFNIGMKNTVPNSPTESYRIIAGPRADEAIQKSDGRMFHRGHVFGKGTDDGEEITIGYSSGSKVWSNRRAQIPELVTWCRLLAQKISSEEQPQVTRSGLDNLLVGEEIRAIPRQAIVAANWHDLAYRTSLSVRYPHSDGGIHEGLLVDLRLDIDREAVTESTIPFVIVGDGFQVDACFHLEGGQFDFELGGEPERVSVTRREDGQDLVDWLRNYPIDFYLADFSRLRGAELFRTQLDQHTFDRESITTFDWSGQGVDITREFGPGDGRSIHDFVRDELSSRDDGVVIYDHRTGEIADFVMIRSDGEKGEIILFHVKASSSSTPGDRVADVYEVCGQVVRSLRWLHDLSRIRERLTRRLATGSEIVVGDQSRLESLLSEVGSLSITYRVVVVQPGLSQVAIGADNQHVLAAANDYLIRLNAGSLELWGSE